jgi:potassium-transporting ATPase KdpC subunit
MNTIFQSLRIFAVLTIFTGVLYPFAVTGISWICFLGKANGSQVTRDGQVVGSSLLAQKLESDRYFWPRPSAADFATVTSGASNLGLTSAKLKQQVAERAGKLREAHHLPADTPLALDMIYTSGSGLDPHISPEAARLQAVRVAKARNLDEHRVTELLDRSIEGPQLTVLGEPRVNVLKLNLALDAM